MTENEKITALLTEAEKAAHDGDKERAKELLLMALNKMKIEHKKWKQSKTR